MEWRTLAYHQWRLSSNPEPDAISGYGCCWFNANRNIWLNGKALTPLMLRYPISMEERFLTSLPEFFLVAKFN